MPRLLLTTLATTLVTAAGFAQTPNYFGTSGVLSGNVWSTSSSGPYTSALDTTNGAVIHFGNPATFDGGSITVAGINATANASLNTAGGTISNFNNGIVTVNVEAGATLDFGSQAFTSSNTAGYIKTGTGVLALSGGTYKGGFTLNAGTVVARAANALGSGTGQLHTLTLNGGILAASQSVDLSNKFRNGIVIGGNIQLGDATGLASNTASMTFSNNVNLGSASRTITLGHAGTTTFNGILSGIGGGFTLMANANGTNGKLVLGGANNYTGATSVSGGILQFNGSAANIAGTTRNVSVGLNGTLTTGYALDNATLNRITRTSNGVVALSADSGSNLDMSLFTNSLSLGALGGTTSAPIVYSGTLAPSATNGYRLGGGGGVLEVSSGLTGNSNLNITRAGTIILSGENTYTGSTSLLTGTLLVNGSIESGTQGINTDTTTTLGGIGSIRRAVEVRRGATLRGGFAGGNAAQATGTLTLASTTFNASTGATGATLAVDLNNNPTPSIAAGSNSMLAFGTNTFNLLTGIAFNIRLLNDAALSENTSYTINVASGNFQKNGGAASFTAGDFNLLSDSGSWAFNDVSLAVDGNNLRLTFTVVPVPEPMAVLGIAAAGLALASRVRRAWSAA